MKKIITLIFFALILLNVSAQEQQDTSVHMTFKGVPISGTLNEFVAKMKNSGFNQIETADGISILKGDFASYKNCIVGVSTLKDKDLVNRISVIFPEQDNWSSLSSNYNYLKELLTEKYKEPIEIVEEFQTNLQLTDDDDKMHEVRHDGCKYFTTYETNKGKIRLTIDHDGISICFVRLTYYDRINSKIIRKKSLDDL
jgi:hypothetical protein